MGYQGQPYALVSMANKDVYYVGVLAAQEIQKRLSHDGDESPFVRIYDVKQRTEVVLNISQISSVVVKEAANA